MAGGIPGANTSTKLLVKNLLALLRFFALTDVSNQSKINVNVLSHLEKSRVDTLMNTGTEFDAAKKQAQREILAVFSIEKSDINASESLSISDDGEGNAILLALSVILQGYRTPAELSELLADINTDLRPDGKLDSTLTGSKLINGVSLVDLAKVRSNLVTRYQEMGVNAECLFEMNGTLLYPGKESEGTVLLNGEFLTCDDSNGWKLQKERYIELLGDACQKYINNPDSVVQAKFPDFMLAFD